MTDDLKKRRVVAVIEESIGISVEGLAELVGGMPEQIREAMYESAEIAMMIRENEQYKAEEERSQGLNPKECFNECCEYNENAECNSKMGLPQGCLFRMTEPPPNSLDYPGPIPTHAEALRMLSRAKLLEPDEYGKYNGTDYAFHAATKRLWFAFVDLLVKHGEIDPMVLTPKEEQDNEDYVKSNAITLARRYIDDWVMELSVASPVLESRGDKEDWILEEHEYRGRWFQHYKGGKYRVKGSALHTETDEILIVYHCSDSFSTLYVRPFDMFFGNIVIDGIPVPRFTRLETISENRKDIHGLEDDSGDPSAD